MAEEKASETTNEKTVKTHEVKAAEVKTLKKNWFKRFLSTKKGKVLSIVTLVVVAVAVLFTVPLTRYAIAGLILKKDVRISITDSVTQKPVTEAMVALGDLSGKTDGDGVLHLSNVPVGDYTLKVSKKYYESTEIDYVVPIISSPQEAKLSLVATGRQVTVNVTNAISYQPLAKATIRVQDTSAVTDSKGSAVIVLPADKKELKGMVELDGYNKKEVQIKITDQADANKVTLTPAGSVYFLSKQTGKINVMKSNLDGSDSQVVVEGTGNENDNTTVLLAARDWRYLVLSANRTGDGNNNQIYLIDVETGKLSLVDEGNASFELVGWSDHKFVYTLTRNEKKIWDDKRQAVKIYNAETGQLNTVDETAGAGNSYYDAEYEALSRPYILEGKLLYAKQWQSNYGPFPSGEKQSAIMLVTMNNEQKQRIKEFSSTNTISIDSKLYKPQEVYFRVKSGDADPTFYEYEGDSIKSATSSDSKFYNEYYPTYLISPSGEKSFWYEPRNGKNALFIGDKNGDNSAELELQSDYAAYGWFSDSYILLSKDGSELYIAPSSNSFAHNPIKITNYHKPALTFPGYGYGYGGQ